MQVLLRLFSFAATHREVMATTPQVADAGALLGDAAFAARLAFVLRPLLARGQLLLSLLAGQAPPSPLPAAPPSDPLTTARTLPHVLRWTTSFGTPNPTSQPDSSGIGKHLLSRRLAVCTVFDRLS